ncbi:MAG: carbohydrate kinase family protein [Solobacterium sp.]|nr:carbohydrate kinase family protein [Solobacterium sp.]
MKKTIIIGSCHADLITYVKELPKGNEEVIRIRDDVSTDGGGYRSALLYAKLKLPYELISVIGNGVYGDQTVQALRKAGISFRKQEEETAGCTYRLIDQGGHEGVFCAAGNEYDFDSEAAEETDLDETGYILVNSEILSGQDPDELIWFLEEAEKPVILVLKDRLQEIDENVMDAVMALHPILILNENESWISGVAEEELSVRAEALHEMNENIVVILTEEGSYFIDEDGSGMSEREDPAEPCWFAAALSAALTAGVDLKNSIVFADEASAQFEDSFTPEEEDAEPLRKRLVEMIQHA